jgi:hypothetical protein
MDMLYKDLSENERHMLLEFPAYVSLLAANADGHMSDKEKQKAISITHMKTYSCDPLLTPFYKDADKVFMENIDRLDAVLPKTKKEREEAIKASLNELEPLLNKLGKDYSWTMRQSMKSYAQHVSKVHGNVLVSFLIPFINWD